MHGLKFARELITAKTGSNITTRNITQRSRKRRRPLVGGRRRPKHPTERIEVIQKIARFSSGLQGD